VEEEGEGAEDEGAEDAAPASAASPEWSCFSVRIFVTFARRNVVSWSFVPLQLKTQ